MVGTIQTKKTWQKQPLRCVLKKRCSESIQQIYRRTPCQIVISIKLPCNFIEIALRHGVLLWICCIFLEYLFLGTSLRGCFCHDYLLVEMILHISKIKQCFLISSNHQTKVRVKFRYLLSNTRVHLENGVASKTTCKARSKKPVILKISIWIKGIWKAGQGHQFLRKLN